MREVEANKQLAAKGKHGISMISGNSSPIVGEKNTYHIAGWYEDTPQIERNPATVTWELFKKRSNGKFTSTNIKKTGNGTFTFGEMSIRNTYRLKAYLYRPEGGGLIINPKPSATPRIGKVELHYVDDKKSDTFSFYDRLRAKAHTTGMLRKELVFILWEDDSKGGGHSAGNQPIEVKSARVQHNGLAVVEFTLTKGLMQKAMKGEADAKEFEFYVTVEYYKGKIHDSKNVNVHNPFHKAPEKKVSHPKAAGSPAEQKPPSKREEKNLLFHQADGYLLHDWAEVKGKAQKNKEVTVNRTHGRSTVGVKAPPAVKQKVNEDLKNCYCFLQGIAKTPCNGKGSSVTDEHYQNLAKDIGVEAKVFKTVAIVESGGRRSFINYKGEQRAKILYERHYMYRFLKRIKSQSELEKLKKDSPDLVHNVGTYKDPNAKYGSETEQFEKLTKAKKINNDAAIKSCSWGKFQVMGKYYSYLYSCPNELEEAMNICEVQHFANFKVFLKDVTGAPIIKAMKDKNWSKIAELYNGEDYATNRYHTKMKNEYNKL